MKGGEIKMVRAKFYVYSLRQFASTGQVAVELWPVTDGSEENKNFWKYTPAGKIEMTIDNPEAVKQLELGKEFYVDFTKAEEDKV